MNRELLARVRDRIAEVGDEHCSMWSWLAKDGMEDDDTVTMPGSGAPMCGTTACIAGHTVAVGKGRCVVNDATEADACRLLGISEAEGAALFFHDEWPEHYQDIMRSESDAKAMLSVCDALLDGALAFDEYGALREQA